MARTKEFDRDDALGKAVLVFADGGFEGASTDVLLKRMGISRQSLYDTFGDKRRLYLEALSRYSSRSTAEIIADMHSRSSALKGLEAALLGFADRPASEPENGCLGVSSICEFGTSDRDVSMINKAASATMLAAFRSLVEKGKSAGEFASDVDAQASAEFLASTLSGMKVAARGGASRDVLRGIVKMAMRSLT